MLSHHPALRCRLSRCLPGRASGVDRRRHAHLVPAGGGAGESPRPRAVGARRASRRPHRHAHAELLPGARDVAGADEGRTGRGADERAPAPRRARLHARRRRGSRAGVRRRVSRASGRRAQPAQDGRAVRLPRSRRARRPGVRGADRRGAARGSARGRHRARRHGLALLHLRHHRASQGRRAHAPRAADDGTAVPAAGAAPWPRGCRPARGRHHPRLRLSPLPPSRRRRRQRLSGDALVRPAADLRGDRAPARHDDVPGAHHDQHAAGG